MGTKSIATPITLAAGTPVKVVDTRIERRSLILQNTGTGLVSFGIGHSPAAGGGISLDPASAANGQGGSFQVSGDDCPVDAVYAISAAGTTIYVLEGIKS